MFHDVTTTSRLRAAGGMHRGSARLTEALAIVKQAEALGAAPLSTATISGCIHFYLGQFGAAKRAFKRAEGHLPATAPTETVAALKANDALVRWAEWMAGHAVGPQGPTPAWRRRARQASHRFRHNKAVVAYMRTGATGRVDALTPSGAQQCKAIPEPQSGSEGSLIAAGLPTPQAEGDCPCGWRLLHHMKTANDRGAVRVCVPGQGRGGLRYFHLDLPGVTPVNIRIVVQDDPRGPLSHIATWQNNCHHLEMRGVSDTGDVVWVGACDTLGAPHVVLLATSTCSVRTVATMAHGGG